MTRKQAKKADSKMTAEKPAISFQKKSKRELKHKKSQKILKKLLIQRDSEAADEKI